jgi:hypothetical protein
MSSTPQPEPSAPLWIGIAQFNQGEFYACHDTLEAIWMTAAIPEKPFYQGILQISVALYHLSNQNWQGAAILLGEGINRLVPFEPSYQEVDVSHLLDQACIWLERLQQLGPDQVSLLTDALNYTSQGQSGPGITDSLPKWEIRRADEVASNGIP